jgi:polyisoprenoid-binding protein YceI
MIRRTSLRAAALAITLVGLAGVRAAEPDAPAAKQSAKEQIAMTGTGNIAFKGFSTLHNFEGQAAVQPFTIKLSPGVGSGKWSAEADVSVPGMSTGNRSRDKEMCRMFTADSYSLIHGKVTNAAIPAGGSGTVTMQLRIRNEEHPVSIAIQNWRQTKDELRFTGSGEVSLSQYGLQPPSVAGVIRVKNTVTLEAQFTATRRATIAEGAGR